MLIPALTSVASFFLSGAASVRHKSITKIRPMINIIQLCILSSSRLFANFRCKICILLCFFLLCAHGIINKYACNIYHRRC